MAEPQQERELEWYFDPSGTGMATHHALSQHGFGPESDMIRAYQDVLV